MSAVEDTMAELVAMGLVEATGDTDADGHPRYRVTAAGKARVEGMADDALEQAVRTFSFGTSLPQWMARDIIFARAAYLKGLDE